MLVIEDVSIKDVWKKSKELILKNGKQIKDGSDVLSELLNLFLKITDPETSSEERIVEDQNLKTWMMQNFQDIKLIPELHNSKSYAWRLYLYNGKDQIKWIIDRLIKKPESKSATITTFLPFEDEKYVPCVSLLDFKIRENALILTTTCRSLDFGMKALYNLYCLSDILHHIASSLHINKMILQVHVISAHVYEKDVK
ncbi:MAG: hypothetical protein EAX96_07930 [Candidatus Lokiarchaeota archaeon]|nr:hypothetical protein [Candidatus Lokiarchaeota archaeon]